MLIRTIRRLTDNDLHNAFTGAAWFKGDLYVAYRQGDDHVDPQGRLMVLRSRDQGKTFDTVAAIRGEHETRDAHLYAVGNERLCLVGFEGDASKKRTRYSGVASTTDGSIWSGWTRFTGCEHDVMWRPRYHNGMHYCVGYNPYGKDNGGDEQGRKATWYQSKDGIAWEAKHILHQGHDNCSEGAIWFNEKDDSVKVLLRRELAKRYPVLYQSKAPFEKWTATEISIPLHGPAIWEIAGDTFIGGRWYPNPQTPLTAIFKLDDKLQPHLQTVLPSGPGFDHSYIGPAPCPDDPYRIMLSYYSAHASRGTPTIPQQCLPDIFLVEAEVNVPWLSDWKVSPIQPGSCVLPLSLKDKPAGSDWADAQATPGDNPSVPGYVPATAQIQSKEGVVWLTTTVKSDSDKTATLRLGYDGPIRAWINNDCVVEYALCNTLPCRPDLTKVNVKLVKGDNTLTIALQSRGGKSTGIFARCH